MGMLPYTTEQVILNALCLLMALQIFPLREFDMWENTTIKTYPALKTFIDKAYSGCLNSMELCNTSSSLGYTAPAHNMYHMLDMGKDSKDDITVATIAMVAAATTTSLLGHGTAASSLHPRLIATINQSITLAFNQVMQNQTILQNQIAAMSKAQPPLTQALANQYIVPPVPHVAFPMQQPVQAHMQQQQYHQTNGFGCGGQGGRGCGCSGSCGGHQHCPLFVAQICAQDSQGQMVQYQGHNGGIFAPPNPYGGISPFAPTPQAQPANNAPSPVKLYANWNACFLCGFDIKGANNLASFPFMWRKPNHQVGCTRENAALYAAYGLSTKGQHITQFLPM